jgi:hypothetical protein
MTMDVYVQIVDKSTGTRGTLSAFPRQLFDSSHSTVSHMPSNHHFLLTTMLQFELEQAVTPSAAKISVTVGTAK